MKIKLKWSYRKDTDEYYLKCGTCLVAKLEIAIEDFVGGSGLCLYGYDTENICDGHEYEYVNFDGDYGLVKEKLEADAVRFFSQCFSDVGFEIDDEIFNGV